MLAGTLLPFPDGPQVSSDATADAHPRVPPEMRDLVRNKLTSGDFKDEDSDDDDEEERKKGGRLQGNSACGAGNSRPRWLKARLLLIILPVVALIVASILGYYNGGSNHHYIRTAGDNSPQELVATTVAALGCDSSPNLITRDVCRCPCILHSPSGSYTCMPMAGTGARAAMGAWGLFRRASFGFRARRASGTRPRCPTSGVHADHCAASGDSAGSEREVDPVSNPEHREFYLKAREHIICILIYFVALSLSYGYVVQSQASSHRRLQRMWHRVWARINSQRFDSPHPALGRRPPTDSTISHRTHSPARGSASLSLPTRRADRAASGTPSHEARTDPDVSQRASTLMDTGGHAVGGIKCRRYKSDIVDLAHALDMLTLLPRKSGAAPQGRRLYSSDDLPGSSWPRAQRHSNELPGSPRRRPSISDELGTANSTVSTEATDELASLDFGTSGSAALVASARPTPSQKMRAAPLRAIYWIQLVPRLVMTFGLMIAWMQFLLLLPTIIMGSMLEHWTLYAAPSSRITFSTLFVPRALIPASTGNYSTGLYTPVASSVSDYPGVLQRLWQYQANLSLLFILAILPFGWFFRASLFHSDGVWPRVRSAIVRVLILDILVATIGFAISGQLSALPWLKSSAARASPGTTVSDHHRHHHYYDSYGGHPLFRLVADWAAVILSAPLRYTLHRWMYTICALPTLLLAAPMGFHAFLRSIRASLPLTTNQKRLILERWRHVNQELPRAEKMLFLAKERWREYVIDYLDQSYAAGSGPDSRGLEDPRGSAPFADASHAAVEAGVSLSDTPDDSSPPSSPLFAAAISSRNMVAPPAGPGRHRRSNSTEGSLLPPSATRQPRRDSEPFHTGPRPSRRPPLPRFGSAADPRNYKRSAEMVDAPPHSPTVKSRRKVDLAAAELPPISLRRQVAIQYFKARGRQGQPNRRRPTPKCPPKDTGLESAKDRGESFISALRDVISQNSSFILGTFSFKLPETISEEPEPHAFAGAWPEDGASQGPAGAETPADMTSKPSAFNTMPWSFRPQSSRREDGAGVPRSESHVALSRTSSRQSTIVDAVSNVARSISVRTGLWLFGQTGALDKDSLLKSLDPTDQKAQRERQRLRKNISRARARVQELRRERCRLLKTNVIPDPECGDLRAAGGALPSPWTWRYWSRKFWASPWMRIATYYLVNTLVIVASLLLWLHITAGALSALFVNTPDLTRGHWYFTSRNIRLTSAPGGLPSPPSPPSDDTGGDQSQETSIWLRGVRLVRGLLYPLGGDVGPQGRAPIAGGDVVGKPSPYAAWLPFIVAGTQFSAAILLYLSAFSGLSSIVIDFKGAGTRAEGAPCQSLVARLVSKCTPRAWMRLPSLRFGTATARTSRALAITDSGSCYKGSRSESLLGSGDGSDSLAIPTQFASSIIGARSVLRRRYPRLLVLVIMALTWPAVLRTVGIISERVFLLTMMPLVEPILPPALVEWVSGGASMGLYTAESPALQLLPTRTTQGPTGRPHKDTPAATGHLVAALSFAHTTSSILNAALPLGRALAMLQRLLPLLESLNPGLVAFVTRMAAFAINTLAFVARVAGALLPVPPLALTLRQVLRGTRWVCPEVTPVLATVFWFVRPEAVVRQGTPHRDVLADQHAGTLLRAAEDLYGVGGEGSYRHGGAALDALMSLISATAHSVLVRSFIALMVSPRPLQDFGRYVLALWPAGDAASWLLGIPYALALTAGLVIRGAFDAALVALRHLLRAIARVVPSFVAEAAEGLIVANYAWVAASARSLSVFAVALGVRLLSGTFYIAGWWWAQFKSTIKDFNASTGLASSQGGYRFLVSSVAGATGTLDDGNGGWVWSLALQTPGATIMMSQSLLREPAYLDALADIGYSIPEDIIRTDPRGPHHHHPYLSHADREDARDPYATWLPLDWVLLAYRMAFVACITHAIVGPVFNWLALKLFAAHEPLAYLSAARPPLSAPLSPPWHVSVPRPTGAHGGSSHRRNRQESSNKKAQSRDTLTTTAATSRPGSAAGSSPPPPRYIRRARSLSLGL